MRIIEFRVILPMTVEEYHIGQLYAVAQASKNETGGGEGIKVIHNEPFTLDKYKPDPVLPVVDGQSFETGQYTEKTYFLKSKVPGYVRALAPEGALELQEYAWNAFPYCRTVLKNPKYMKDNFFLSIESMHCQDDGSQQNVHQLSKTQLSKREVIYVDLLNDELYSKSDYKAETDPALFKSEKTGRGPLLGKPWWTSPETANAKLPIMCAYKLASFKFDWFGFQTIVESIIGKQERRIFHQFHRQLFCWIDQWHGLTMKDIRELEAKTQKELDEQRAQAGVRGTIDTE